MLIQQNMICLTEKLIFFNSLQDDRKDYFPFSVLKQIIQIQFFYFNKKKAKLNFFIKQSLNQKQKESYEDLNIKNQNKQKTDKKKIDLNQEKQKMNNQNEKNQKRQAKERLEKKLELRQLTLFEALQQDLAVDWFKQSNPAFLALLNPQGMKQMINYIVIPGPQDQKMRSFKVPMIATQILSTPCPKVFQLMFTQDKQARGGFTVGWLVQYFWRGEPNYVISGYVIRILNNLIPGSPHKVLQFMIKNACSQMLKFLESHSVAEFVLRMIIVDDLLLNAFIKQRLQLFNQLVEVYQQNKEDQQTLDNISFMLRQSFHRLWALKNKELGRFSSSLLRMIEVIIDYDDKYQQEKFLPIIVKLLADHGNVAPVLVMVVYKKIYKKLSTMKAKRVRYQNKESIETFSSINFHLLESIESIVNNFSQEFSKFIQKENIYPVLLSFVKRFQWNNIVLVQIEKIIKHSISKKDPKIYRALMEPLIDSIKSWKQLLQDSGKFGRGYKGFLESLEKFINENLQSNQPLKDYLEKANLTNKLQRILTKLDLVKQQNEGFRVVHNIAIPSYKSTTQLISFYGEFFLETEVINKKYQMQNPADHYKHKQDDVLINEIENENQLVYKLLTQTTVPSSTNDDGEKKNNEDSNGSQ